MRPDIRFVSGLLAALFLSLAVPAFAVQPDEILKDPALEARARTIGQELRCLVCQNQSIDDSHAPLARDLRLLVRQRLLSGDSDGQVMDYVTARYGDYVLLKPPFKGATYVLWLGPPALLLMGGAGVMLFLRNRRRAAADPAAGLGLSADEQRRLDALLAGDGTEP